MRSCAFCGAEKKLTSEHIWGDWIKEFVPTTANKHHFGQLIHNKPGMADESSKRPRAGDAVNAHAEILCEHCNNVVLGAVQNKSKPRLIPLLKGEQILLGQEAQKQIATWAAMATMTGEFLNKDRKQIAIPQAEREAFLNNPEPPAHWRIWLGHYRRWRFPSTYVHTALSILSADQVAKLDDPDDPPCNVQTTSIILGSLYLHVISADPSNMEYWEKWNWNTAVRARMLLAQLWPPKEGIILWPFTMMNDQDAQQFSTAFFYHLHGIGRMAGF